MLNNKKFFLSIIIVSELEELIVFMRIFRRKLFRDIYKILQKRNIFVDEFKPQKVIILPYWTTAILHLLDTFQKHKFVDIFVIWQLIRIIILLIFNFLLESCDSTLKNIFEQISFNCLEKWWISKRIWVQLPFITTRALFSFSCFPIKKWKKIIKTTGNVYSIYYLSFPFAVNRRF